MTKSQATKITGGLSKSSKVGWTYSLPNTTCGSNLRDVPGTICSKCYASRGRFVFPNVKKANWRRYLRVLDATAEKWVEAMATLIEPHPWFRWHSSGDILDSAHAALIAAVAARTPFTAHWLPTMMHRIARETQWPDNMTVRLSAPLIDNPITDARMSTSCVFTGKELIPPDMYPCPATWLNDVHSCEQAGCRRCWDPGAGIAYKLH